MAGDTVAGVAGDNDHGDGVGVLGIVPSIFKIVSIKEILRETCVAELLVRFPLCEHGSSKTIKIEIVT